MNALIEVIDAIWKLMEYQVFNQMKIGILQVVKRKQGGFVRQEGGNIYLICLDQTIVQGD